MKIRFSREAVKIFSILIAFIFIIISLVSCNLLSRDESSWEKYKNSYVIGGNTRLYQDIDDASQSEIIEVGTPVRKTRRCRESPIANGEVLCYVKLIFSDKEGWVLEYDLVKFEDYLPANED